MNSSLSFLVGKTQPESILLLPSFPLGEKEISSGEHEQKTSSLPLLSLFVFFLGKGVKKKRKKKKLYEKKATKEFRSVVT